MKRRTA